MLTNMHYVHHLSSHLSGTPVYTICNPQLLTIPVVTPAYVIHIVVLGMCVCMTAVKYCTVLTLSIKTMWLCSITLADQAAILAEAVPQH